MFGSTATRLALRASDIDIVVMLKGVNQFKMLRRVYMILVESN